MSHRIWSWAKPRREAELAKCQVLCGPCHRLKSAGEAAWGTGKVKSVKLSPEDVRAIRASSQSYRQLAKLYRVHHVTIGKIKRGEIWKRLIEPSSSTS